MGVEIERIASSSPNPLQTHRDKHRKTPKISIVFAKRE